eukprot:1667717-Amphidinium_carterae.2
MNGTSRQAGANKGWGKHAGQHSHLYWCCPNPLCGSWEWAQHKACRVCSATAPAWIAKVTHAGPPLPHLDPDGFKVVQNKRNRRRTARRAQGLQQQQQSQTPPQQQQQQQTPQPTWQQQQPANSPGEHANRGDNGGHVPDNLAGPPTKAVRDALHAKLKQQEEALRLLQASGAGGLAAQLTDEIATTREAIREVEPAPKRLQALQLGIQRRKHKLDKLSEQRSSTLADLAGLELEMQNELQLVQERFRAKKCELELKLASLDTQEQNLSEGLQELREVQGDLLDHNDGELSQKDVQTVGRVMQALSHRFPGCAQAFEEMEHLAKTELQNPSPQMPNPAEVPRRFADAKPQASQAQLPDGPHRTFADQMRTLSACDDPRRSHTQLPDGPGHTFADQMRTLSAAGHPRREQFGAGVYSTPVHEPSHMECEEVTPQLECPQMVVPQHEAAPQRRPRSRERRGEQDTGGEDANERPRTRSRTLDVVETSQG